MTMLAASSARADRRHTVRATPERRQSTPLNFWLRAYGPLVGMALMGMSAALFVLLFCVGLWTLT
jgi:hypothetical protein